MHRTDNAPFPPLRRLTLTEWAALPEADSGEYVDGVLEGEEMPDFVHEAVVAWLVEHLRGWVRPRGGFVGASGVKYVVSQQRGRKPDLSVFLAPRKPPARGVVEVPPDIAVEVVSPSPSDARRDRVTKLDEYAAFGVSHYWIVDPTLRSFEVFELADDGAYKHVLGASEGSIENVPGCAGLAIDLDSLWSEVDELAEEGA